MVTSVVNIADLTSEIENILAGYKNEIGTKAESLAKEVAQECVKELKSSSPKRTKAYSKSWTVKELRGIYGEKNRYVVHNKDHYRLTHLLEHGHITRGGSRSKSFNHIKKAEDGVIKAYFEKVVAAINET